MLSLMHRDTQNKEYFIHAMGLFFQIEKGLLTLKCKYGHAGPICHRPEVQNFSASCKLQLVKHFNQVKSGMCSLIARYGFLLFSVDIRLQNKKSGTSIKALRQNSVFRLWQVGKVLFASFIILSVSKSQCEIKMYRNQELMKGNKISRSLYSVM